MSRSPLLLLRLMVVTAFSYALHACDDPPVTPVDAAPVDVTPDAPFIDGPTPDAPDAPAPDAPRDAASDVGPDVAADVGLPDAAGMDAAGMDVATDAPRPDVAADLATRCDGSLAACGALCVDLRADRSHCGACGNACCPGALCVNGRCAPDCMAGRTPCTPPGEACHTCVNLVSDARHCGACNRACAAGQACVDGACRCPAVTEPPPPMGVCDGRGRIACQMWAQGLAGGNPSAVATCLSSPAGCARAEACDDIANPATCRCGASPACPAGEVCVLSGPTARCVCATP
jgi:hypothetical protein